MSKLVVPDGCCSFLKSMVIMGGRLIVGHVQVGVIVGVLVVVVVVVVVVFLY